MRMKIQFEALIAFTFLVGVVFGFVELNDAPTQRLQDRKLAMVEGVPRHTRCITSAKWFGDVNALPYFTRCATEPYGPASPHAGSTLGPNPARRNSYAANAPHEADFARHPTLTIFTEKHTPPYFKGKPGERQTAQTTFNFRAAEMNQPGPHSVFNQFHPFQTTKEYWPSVDESEDFPPINRKYTQPEKIRQRKELRSLGGNTSPPSLPSPSFPEYPSLPFFSEKDEEEDEEEEENPYYPQYISRSFPQEEVGSSLHQYISPSFLPEEEKLHQYTPPPFFTQTQEYTSPPILPQEPGTPMLQYRYSRYARPARLSFFQSDELPFDKSLPFNRDREPFGRRYATVANAND